MKNIEKKYKKLLALHGYIVFEPLKKDSFNRFNAILKNSKGKKYFVKATYGINSYKYRSLFNEAKISEFLSFRLSGSKTNQNNYIFLVPKFKEIIQYEDFIFFISELVKGEKLSDTAKDLQIKILKKSINAVTKINTGSDKLSLQKYLINYNKMNLILISPFRFAKALLRPNAPVFKLIKVYFNFLPLFFIDKVKYSLIHPDINTTNIIVNKKTIYLTDWEESGWGISTYNATAPMLLFEYGIPSNDNIYPIFGNLNKKDVRPLLAYRILSLFNQKTDINDHRHMRDIKLVNKFLKLYK